MRCLIVLVAYLTSAVAIVVDCDTVKCSQDPAVDPWNGLLTKRGLMKDKGKMVGRFWNREMELNSIRRASVRWGKRFDSKQRRMTFRDLLRPTNLAMSRNWTPIISEALPRENMEMDLAAMKIPTSENNQRLLIPHGRLWGR